jgi:hypothetical protein
MKMILRVLAAEILSVKVYHRKLLTQPKIHDAIFGKNTASIVQSQILSCFVERALKNPLTKDSFFDFIS